MTRDEIIRMARDVGAGEPDSLYGRTDYVAMTKHEIERFAALVAAAEREECAKLAAWILKMPQNDVSHAIRARGMK